MKQLEEGMDIVTIGALGKVFASLERVANTKWEVVAFGWRDCRIAGVVKLSLGVAFKGGDPVSLSVGFRTEPLDPGELPGHIQWLVRQQQGVGVWRPFGETNGIEGLGEWCDDTRVVEHAYRHFREHCLLMLNDARALVPHIDTASDP